MLGHHMRAGATTSFDGDKDLESGSEADGSLDDAEMSGDEERDESKVLDLRESVATVSFYTLSIANVSDRSVRERLSLEQKHTFETSSDCAPCPPQDALAARFPKMFDASEIEPKASRLDPVAAEVNKALLKAASQLMLKDVSKETVNALSKAFGNFDRVVGLGRLLADAIGQPLLEHSRAHTVGLAAKYEAGKIKGAIDQYKRDLRRDAGKDASKRQELLVQAARAEDAAPLLQEAVDVGLTAPAPPARSGATGSRKRAREVEEDDDELSRAEAAVLVCIKATKRADAATEAAERTEEVKLKVYERFARKLGELSQDLKSSNKFGENLERFNAMRKLAEQAGREHTAAQFATRDALLAWQGAMLDERDAELHAAELDLKECRELLAHWPARS